MTSKQVHLTKILLLVYFAFMGIYIRKSELFFANYTY